MNPATETNSQPESVVEEYQSLKEFLKSMKMPQLVAYASNKYGLTIEATVKKDVIIDNIIRVDEEFKNKARTLNEKSTALVTTEDDPPIRVRFMRLDFPHADHEFNYDSGRGVRPPANKKGKLWKTQLPYCPGYHLFPGMEYILCLSVIRHLQSLIFKDSKPVVDPVTGMIAGNQTIIRPRFILEPIMSDDDLKRLATPI
jgi:hypothetical protein